MPLAASVPLSIGSRVAMLDATIDLTLENDTRAVSGVGASGLPNDICEASRNWLEISAAGAGSQNANKNTKGAVAGETGIRTPITCSRGRCPTVERSPSTEDRRSLNRTKLAVRLQNEQGRAPGWPNAENRPVVDGPLVQPGPSYTVRQAGGEDVPVLRALRLAALAEASDAFSSTLAREAGRTAADWHRWLAPGATFILTEGADPRGLVAAEPSAERETVWLLAMWLDPALRRSGAADALVRAG